jgi:hypothetical protein
LDRAVATAADPKQQLSLKTQLMTLFKEQQPLIKQRVRDYKALHTELLALRSAFDAYTRIWADVAAMPS